LNKEITQIIIDIDECSGQGGGNNCALGTATCTNTVGGFTCKCNSGYSGTGVTCTGMFLIYYYCWMK